MTIKTRIIAGFLLAIFLISISITALSAWKMREDALGYFFSSTSQQLKLVNATLDDFINTARKNVEVLAASDLATLGDHFPNFKDSTQQQTYRHANLDPQAAQIIKTLVSMDNAYNEYVEIYAGFPKGNYATSLDGASVSPRYATNVRPWYRDSEQSASAGILVNAYKSLTGSMVFAVTHKMFANGVLSGIVGIDISLNNLSKMIADLNFAKTGYFMLIEKSGRILCDQKNPSNIGKIIGSDLQDAGLNKIFNKSSGDLEVTLQSTPMIAQVETTHFGWKIVALQSSEEIYERANHALFQILGIVAVIAILMIGVATFIVLSITKPLGILLQATNRVASGDYSAMPNETRGFYGELLILYQSLKTMVQSIADNVALANEKTKEAEEKSHLAEKATARAEEATRLAEKAKKDGMLAAAERLEDMVTAISAAATELSAQIEQSDRSAAESSRRLAEAAASMREMNASVQDVARNASDAAAASRDTHANAERGQHIISEALLSINAVLKVAQELKADMETLHKHTQNISRIMDVISDIADQTNLLALNAAIEAARAGDAGRGFAVVADEVRKLAEKTMTSTNDVASAITSIQQSAQQSWERMDIAWKNIEQATQLAEESGKALTQIVSSVENTADEVRAIATASEEQSASSGEITSSISYVSDVSHQTTQAMGESAKAISDLARQTEQLSVLIKEMKQS
ncbi:MAG: chemotaxis protein [Desulfovibrionaceae bacterium]|nr:chemotaxis protein [Desulfovibrionaceae bacterium]